MPVRPSVGEELFNRILAHDGFPDVPAFLHSWIKSEPPMFESEHLDFKSASYNGSPIKDADEKKAWCEALSGFATTGGGVLVWGIDARKYKLPEGEIDCAGGYNPVISPREFRSRLQEQHHQATDPPVPGVRIEAFPDPADGGRGFVVCYVPESDYKPHRSEAGGKRWLMRMGDSFVDVSPPILRSLFAPVRKSYISARCAAIGTHADKNMVGAGVRAKAGFQIRLENHGPATADQLTMVFESKSGQYFGRTEGWVPSVAVAGFRIRYQHPFHVSDIIEVCEVTFDYMVNWKSGLPVPIYEDVEMAMILYAQDQPPYEYRFAFTAAQVEAKATIEALPVPHEFERR